jgi:hypothetical protein
VLPGSAASLYHQAAICGEEVMSLPAERTPVIIGVGEFLDRPADPALALEPLALMDAAVRAACFVAL